MNPENRNMILAITLSMAVLFGWQVFVVGPELEKEAARQQAIAEMQAEEAAAENATPQAAADTATPSGMAVTESRPVDNAPRIIIDAPLVSGSISLAGARIDDVMLKGYRETQSDDAPFIQFLQKTSSDLPYFAEFGWAAGGGEHPMPTADSLWSADRQTLAPGAPVSLSWDNGQGLTFRRTLSINEDYLITVDDSVESRLEAPVTLFPYGLVRRHGTPPTTGIYILHEGALGVFDETLREEDYDDMKDADGGVIDVAPESAGGWIGITDKYWLAALVPDQSVRINYAF